MTQGLGDNDEAQTQLATRIPKTLHRRMKLHCSDAETTVMEFAIAAIEERLARETKRAIRRGLT